MKKIILSFFVIVLCMNTVMAQTHKQELVDKIKEKHG